VKSRLFLALLLAIALRGSTSLICHPPVTVWAWERREDFRSLDPAHFRVAFLASTIFITDRVAILPRRQPLLVAPGAHLTAVIRIEAPTGVAQLTGVNLPAHIAATITDVLARSGATGLQIDFDAVRSQRSFYTELLRELRRRIPTAMPLSVTALASWCAADDWISALPIDEAIPMYFRMGRDHPPARVPGWSYPVHEPLCAGAAGLSMDEAWPALAPTTHLYVFHPRRWNEVAFANLQRLATP
jgi:hypothetical protein